MRFKRAFDFRQFDAVTAQFHLVIATADEFDDAVWTASRQIARPIDASAATEGIRRESIRGQVRTSEVASASPSPPMNSSPVTFAGSGSRFASRIRPRILAIGKPIGTLAKPFCSLCARNQVASQNSDVP